jgi:hypothetical protein
LSGFNLTRKGFLGVGSAYLPELEVMDMKGIWLDDLINALKITYQ